MNNAVSDRVSIGIEGQYQQTPAFLFRQLLYYTPSIIIPAVLSVLSIAVYTRLFSPYDFGLYSLVLAGANILAMVCGDWIMISILRFQPEYGQTGRSCGFIQGVLLLTAIAIVCLIALASAAYMIAKPWLRSYEYESFFYWSIWLASGMIVFTNLSTLFQADLDARQYAKYIIASAILQTGGGLFLVIYVFRDIRMLFLASIISYITLSIGIMFELQSKGRYGQVDFETAIQAVKEIVAYGLPMVGWYLCMQGLGTFDRFILGYFRGPAEVGIYASANSVVLRGLGLVLAPLWKAINPQIMHFWESKGKSDVQEMEAEISYLSRIMLLIVLPIIVGMSVLSREVTALLLGKEFFRAYAAIPVLTLGFGILTLAFFAQKGLELEKRTGTLLKVAFVAILLNLLLNSTMSIPLFGFEGAAWTMAGSYLFYFSSIYWVNRHSSIQWRVPWRSLGRILLASVVMGSALFALRSLEPLMANLLWFTLAIVMAALVYLGVIYISGEVSRDTFNLTVWYRRLVSEPER